MCASRRLMIVWWCAPMQNEISQNAEKDKRHAMTYHAESNPLRRINYFATTLMTLRYTNVENQMDLSAVFGILCVCALFISLMLL